MSNSFFSLLKVHTCDIDHVAAANGNLILFKGKGYIDFFKIGSLIDVLVMPELKYNLLFVPKKF